MNNAKLQKKKSKQQFAATLITIGLLGLAWWFNTDNSISQSSNANITEKRLPCRVLNVYDGDTLACDINGDGKIQKPKERIRLLAIDSPEMHYSKKNKSRNGSHSQNEPFAKEASLFLKKSLEDKVAYLEFDQKKTDPYGRTLAYVFEGPKTKLSICEKILLKGYATIMFIPPNTKYKSVFSQAETAARQKGLGVWSY